MNDLTTEKKLEAILSVHGSHLSFTKTDGIAFLYSVEEDYSLYQKTETVKDAVDYIYGYLQQERLLP